MMNFFGWNGDVGMKPEAPRLVVDACREDASDPLLAINRLCQGTDAHAFLRPLSSVLMAIGEVLRAHPISSSIVAREIRHELSMAAEFLSRSEDPARHLEFALAAHTDEAPSRRFFAGIERVLGRLAHEPFGSPLQALLHQWRREATAFSRSCREVWELHAYFVFLDVKGDRVLFEQVARQICRLLGCTARCLVSCFEYARPWVEEVLRALANRELGDMLERLHADALRQWRAAWRERVEPHAERFRFPEDAQQRGREFWESYFTHLFKITWPDFVEAFEHYYINGRCPLDVMSQLRLRVDPTLRHTVSRSAWQGTLHGCKRISDLMDMLLDEVFDDIDARVYRPVPLRSLVRSRPKAVATDGGALEEPAETSSSSSSKAPAVGASESVSAAPSSGSQAAAAAQKPKPWYPFAHSSLDDGDMAIPTPHDLRLRQGATSEQPSGDASKGAQQPTMTWDEFVTRLCAQSRPWWGALDEAPALEDTAAAEPLRMAALRTVSSSINYTYRALILRVVSGDLAQNMPVLETPKKELAAIVEGDMDPSTLPALVITANGTRFFGVTKFGRSSSRRTLLPDCPMSEPIASRSHFSIVYEQETDRYYLMDAGSKWGTFMKIGSSVTLSCGDWIRVGGVEFIIRYCGGGCGCRKQHAHYRLHSLRLLRDHQGDGPRAARKWSTKQLGEDDKGHDDPWSQSLDSNAKLPPHSKSAADVAGLAKGCDFEDDGSRLRAAQSSPLLTSLSGSVYGEGGGIRRDVDDDSSSEDERSRQLQDELMLLLSSRRPRGWTPASARLCQKAATRDAGIPTSVGPVGGDAADPTASIAPCSPERPSIVAAGCLRPPKEPAPAPKHPNPHADSGAPAVASTTVPISPLELDFISGPRMGEKLVLNERVCTLGRGEGNTIQVSDSQLASVSRVHCIFEYSGNRWHMRDNGSTNGTWRRLSCVLEPSEPVRLRDGVSIQAGVHEFLVEEAEMRHWWLPCTAFASFEELCEQERRERKPTASHRDPGNGVSGGDPGSPSSPS